MKPIESMQSVRSLVIRPTIYCIRHDSGAYLEVQALTPARARKLIEAECQDRGWLLSNIDWFTRGKNGQP